MTVNLDALRPGFSSTIGRLRENGGVEFTDQMDKFVDDMIINMDSTSSDLDTLTSDVSTLSSDLATLSDDVDTLTAQVSVEDWREVGTAGQPAFMNSWVNFDASRALSFRLVNGVLYMKGAVKNGTSATANIFTLPAGYRPTESRILSSYTSAGFAPLLVRTSGIVSINSGGSTAQTYLEAVVPL